MEKLVVEEEQVKYFRTYTVLPKIVAIVLFVLFAIWAIVDPLAIQVKVSVGTYFTTSKVTYYGVMKLKNGFFCWLIWMLVGAVVSVGTYFLLKLRYSYKLLHILYLQKQLGEEVSAENRIDV